MYSDKVMDHFKNPRNVGEIENASGVGTVGNAKCGDIMRIYLDIDENQIIQDVKFKTFGCGAAIATSSISTEMIKGKTVEEAIRKAGYTPGVDVNLAIDVAASEFYEDGKYVLKGENKTLTTLEFQNNKSL